MGLFGDLFALIRKNFSFRLIVSFSDNFLSYLFPSKKRFFGPSYISWNITDRCNLKCSFCELGYEKNKVRNELNTDEAKSLISQASKSGSYGFCFTGGEPFIREDIFELIEYAKSKGLFVNLNTNGFFLKESIDSIIDSNLDSITVSIDSLSGSKHDRLRGVKGAYDRAVSGILELMKSKGNSNMKVGVRLVISKENYKELGEYLKYWKKKVDFVRFQPIVDSTIKDCIFKIDDTHKEMIDFNHRLFADELEGLIESDSDQDTLYNRGIVMYFRDLNRLKRNNKCCAGNITLKFDSVGNAYMCSQLYGKLGNIRDQTLYELWNSKKINKYRKHLKESKNKCFCWTNDYIPILYFYRLARMFGKK